MLSPNPERPHRPSEYANENRNDHETVRLTKRLHEIELGWTFGLVLFSHIIFSYRKREEDLRRG